MKNYFIVGLILMLGIVSCKKEETADPAPEKPVNYMPLTTGSYWVYDTYSIDSTGKEILFRENDTITIVGDTVLNGKTHKIFHGIYVSDAYRKKYYRDSSGCILLNNKVIFNSNNFTDTLYKKVEYISDKVWFTSYILMKKVDKSVIVPAGNYDNILNANLILEVNDSLKTKMSFNKIYASETGLILEQYAWVAEYLQKKKYYERRLKSFFIAKNNED